MCISFLGLPWQSTINWELRAIQIYSHILLGTRRLKSRCWQCWFLLRARGEGLFSSIWWFAGYLCHSLVSVISSYACLCPIFSFFKGHQLYWSKGPPCFSRTSFKLVIPAKIPFPNGVTFWDNCDYEYKFGGDTIQLTYGVIKISTIKLLKIKNQQFLEPTHFMQKKVETRRYFRVWWRGRTCPLQNFSPHSYKSHDLESLIGSFLLHLNMTLPGIVWQRW